MEEPLRFSIGLPKLKGIGELFAEPFLGSVNPYETLKVLPLDTGLVMNLFFLECMPLPLPLYPYGCISQLYDYTYTLIIIYLDLTLMSIH